MISAAADTAPFLCYSPIPADLPFSGSCATSDESAATLFVICRHPPTNQPTNQPNQPISQSTNQPINQPTNQQPCLRHEATISNNRDVPFFLLSGGVSINHAELAVDNRKRSPSSLVYSSTVLYSTPTQSLKAEMLSVSRFCCFGRAFSVCNCLA